MNLKFESSQRSIVATDSIIRVVAVEFLPQFDLLLGDRQMPIRLAPLGNTNDRPSETARCCLPFDNPLAHPPSPSFLAQSLFGSRIPGKHAFVVVSHVLHLEPKNWTNAIVCDPWREKVYHATQIRQNEGDALIRISGDFGAPLATVKGENNEAKFLYSKAELEAYNDRKLKLQNFKIDS